MSRFNRLDSTSTAAPEELEHSIRQRTHSRVQDLQVELGERDITVFGRVGSYHILQLVLEVVKELQAKVRVPVRIQVQVFQRPSVA